VLCYFSTSGQEEVTTKEISEVEENLKKICETLPQPNKYVAIVYYNVWPILLISITVYF